MLVPHIIPESFEEDQKGELDTPETGVEENDDSDSLSQVLCRCVLKPWRRWIKLARRHCHVLVKGVLAELP